MFEEVKAKQSAGGVGGAWLSNIGKGLGFKGA